MPEPAPKRPPNGAVRVALQGSYGGAKWVNRFWLNTTMSAKPTGAQVLALSNAVSAAWRTRFLASLSTALTLSTQRTVLYYDATTEIAVDGADTGSGTESSGVAEGAQVAFLINWSISGSYRGGHPRTYLCGVPQDHTTNAIGVTSGAITTLTTAAGNFLSDVNALTPSPFTAVTLGTFRFFRAHAAVDPPVFEPFLAGACSPLLATQRRRIGR